MTKNNSSPYSHIKSFKDFETEKMHLHYQIRFAERKLELRAIELRMYFNPVKLAQSFLTSMIEPLFLLLKNTVAGWFRKDENKEPEQANDTDQVE